LFIKGQVKNEFGRDSKSRGGLKGLKLNSTLENDFELVEMWHPSDGPNPFTPRLKAKVHYNVPVAVPCKGNCPLKNNLLPKYTPDDGGTLRCPEDNGKHFRAETNALFEISCYSDFLGRELKSQSETSLDACIKTCTHVQQCRAVVFTPNDIDGPCVLKFHEGRSHVNPFVMSARLVASDCTDGTTNELSERHNRVWEMEQEEARQVRHRVRMEDARLRIESLRRERASIEQQRHQNRVLRYRKKVLDEGVARANAHDRARYEAYEASEDEYHRKKLREQNEALREREREQRRFGWKMAVEERERERLRRQVERERAALEAEMDTLRRAERSGDEAWWTAGRRRQVHGPGRYEISPAARGAGSGDHVAGRAGVPAAAGGYPGDEDWRWNPDKSWQEFLDAEGPERDVYEGWASGDESAKAPPLLHGASEGRDAWKQLETDVSRLKGVKDAARPPPA
jgi:hypothetical protein